MVVALAEQEPVAVNEGFAEWLEYIRRGRS